MWVAETVQWAVPQKSEWVGGALVKAGGPGWGQAQVGCRSSLRRGRGRHDGVRGVYWPAGSIRGATTPNMGVMTCTTRADQGKAEGGVHACLLYTSPSPRDRQKS